MLGDNPFDGISDACSPGWQSSLPMQPINLVESMKAMFQQIQEREIEDRKRMIEWGERMGARRKADPIRYDAELQAALEIFTRIGDPVNPIITSPNQYKRWQERTEELIKKPQPFRYGG